MFVDASALVAIIAGEQEQDRLGTLLRDEPAPLWSAMSCWEAISGLRSSYGWSVAAARREVEMAAARFALKLVAVGERERAAALDAYERFGRGSGHRAKLNMGDCFAYACAKANGAKLLYKGTDFVHTDLA
ncbi:type II toxin-antitoxin system VapC family toxin [Sphingomonas sp.]|uniref:type II toxin-antitoxin system VapC family toxin n=1 Tax=Sphingomonas sp. TaxID=28214 RepID=UPI003AFF97A8